MKNHADLLKDVEFLMTEGGENLVDDGKLEYYGVGVSEKQTFWQKVVGERRAVARLAADEAESGAAARRRDGQDREVRDAAPRARPTCRNSCTTSRRSTRASSAAGSATCGAAIKNPRARKWITDNIYWNAILRNTISLTVLSGLEQDERDSGGGDGGIDIRLLPDTDPHEFLATLKAIVERHRGALESDESSRRRKLQSPIDTDLFRAIEKASHERNPDVIVTTPMFTAATDRPFYRALGIVTYGFDPFLVENEEMHSGMHGNNERLAVRTLDSG